MPMYSLMATLKRWNGEAKAWLESTPSICCLSMPASANALPAASAASASALLPGTRPTAEMPAPMIAVLPRSVFDEDADLIFAMKDEE